MCNPSCASSGAKRSRTPGSPYATTWWRINRPTLWCCPDIWRAFFGVALLKLGNESGASRRFHRKGGRTANAGEAVCGPRRVASETDRVGFCWNEKRCVARFRWSILPSSTDLGQRGLRLFADRMDKDWSLTDCISFVMMHQHELQAAVTTERHFEQAGSVAPLK
jgi:hypothetical protein